MKIGSCIHIFVLLTIATCQPACKREIPVETVAATIPRIIEPAQAYRLLDSLTDVSIIEVSQPDDFALGHLPGALRLWRPDYEDHDNYPYEGMRATQAQMEALLSRLGVKSGQFILLYDRSGNVESLRLAWLLDLYGHREWCIMNGGIVAWQQEGFPISDKQSTPIATTYRFAGAPAQEQMVADMEEVLAALQDTNVVLLDTREEEEYLGLPYIDKGEAHPWKKGAATFGRIPGAVHINWSEAVELDVDHRLKSLRALRWNFTSRGITPDKKIITYCQSGVRSAHTTFVLKEVLGYPEVKNYDGSWIEWSYHYKKQQDVPITQELTELQHQERLMALKKVLSARL